MKNDEVEACESGKVNTKRDADRSGAVAVLQRRAEVRQISGGAALRGWLNTEAVTWVSSAGESMSTNIRCSTKSCGTHVKIVSGESSSAGPTFMAAPVMSQ